MVDHSVRDAVPASSAPVVRGLRWPGRLFLLAGLALTAWLLAHAPAASAGAPQPTTVNTGHTASQGNGNRIEQSTPTPRGPVRSRGGRLGATPGRLGSALVAAPTRRAVRALGSVTAPPVQLTEAAPAALGRVLPARAVLSVTSAVTSAATTPVRSTAWRAGRPVLAVPQGTAASLGSFARLAPADPLPGPVHTLTAGLLAAVPSALRPVAEPFPTGRLAPGQPGALPYSGPVPPTTVPLAPAVGGAHRQALPLPVVPAQRPTRPGPTGVGAARPGMHPTSGDRVCGAAVAHCAPNGPSTPVPPEPSIPTPPVPGSSLPDPSSRAHTGPVSASPAAPSSVPGVRPGAQMLRVPAVALSHGVCQRAEDPSFSPD